MSIYPVGSIAVVDELDTHREAAKAAITKLLPNALVHLYANPRDIIAAIGNKTPHIDMVITEMTMQGDRQAGLAIVQEAWSWNLPAVALTERILGDGTGVVHLGQPPKALNGKLDDPHIWELILRNVLWNEGPGTDVVRTLKTGRRLAAAHFTHGYTCAYACIPNICFPL